MNLYDSLKLVLSTKSSKIFFEYWRDDFKSILHEIKHEIISDKKKKSTKFSFRNLLDSTTEVVAFAGKVPTRLRGALVEFREEFLRELKSLPDSTDKMIFCIKVAGALSSLSVGLVYEVKKARHELTLPGLKNRNALTQLIVAELVLRMSRLFLIRLLVEVENHLSDVADKKNIRFIRDLLRSPSDVLPLDVEPQDRALRIIDSLRQSLFQDKKPDISDQNAS